MFDDLLLQADVTVSEKFRRVLEAYQIEVDYGRNIEAYRAKQDNISYDFLRVGRLALYRLSNDGQQAWLWHPNKEWIALEDRKSTRLNSSHVRISYAVFCLKKKK